MTTPLLSVVIPAWNEASLLPRLFDSIESARTRWREAGNSADGVEIIVADNASSDGTASIAAQRGARVVPVEKRVIAAARNGGAAAARGEILAFVDADSVLHPDSFVAVAAAMAKSGVVGGSTGVTMERWSPGITVFYLSCLPMVWLTGFDTGLVFWRRADFDELGGYDESRLLAEDVDFLFRLRRLGRTRGQRMVRLRKVKAITSARKFDAHGDCFFFTRIPRVLWRALRDPGAIREFAQRYWYDGR